MTQRSAFPNYLGFATVALAVNAIAYFATHSSVNPAMRTGVFLDCAITVPALYWLLLVRPGLRNRQSLAVIASISMLRGAYVLSSQAGSALAVVAEAVLVGVLISGRKTLIESIPMLKVVRAELDILRYAFFPPKLRLPLGAKAFTIHKTSGAALLFFMLAAITPVEAVLIHVVLPKTLGWIATGLSIYGAIWMVAVARSFDVLPIVVDENGILLRRGLLARVFVPYDVIESISQTPIAGVKFEVLADPAVFIRFNRPLVVELPLGFERRTTAVSLTPDDVTGFLEATAR